MGTSRLSKADVQNRFMNDMNCCQCVLTQWEDELGYDADELQRIAAAFGGGMFRGDTCGAVTGALMALGMAFGGSGTAEDVDLMHEKVAQFREEFTRRCGALTCREQLGYDFSVPGEKQKAIDCGIMMDHCPTLVMTALEILDDMLAEL